MIRYNTIFVSEGIGMLSEAERAFLKDVSKNNLKQYSTNYRCP